MTVLLCTRLPADFVTRVCKYRSPTCYYLLTDAVAATIAAVNAMHGSDMAPTQESSTIPVGQLCDAASDLQRRCTLSLYDPKHSTFRLMCPVPLPWRCMGRCHLESNLLGGHFVCAQPTVHFVCAKQSMLDFYVCQGYEQQFGYSPYAVLLRAEFRTT
jgi:hypothetical protein